MLRNLHSRLALSHTLPILILTPMLAAVLLYLLETRYSLGDIADQLTGQSTLIQQITHDDTSIWADADKALHVIEDVKANISSRIMLLDKDGHLLASSLSNDGSRVGRYIDFPVISNARMGQTSWLVDYSPFMKTRILDMASPVMTDDGKQIGIIRLSYDITEIEQRTVPIRWLIGITFAGGSICALFLGLWLARSLSTPLSLVSSAVSGLVPENRPLQLPEIGPKEIRRVASSYNQMAQRLYELEMSRRQLLANVVHELGTPLGAIKAAADALHNGAVSDPTLATDLAVGISSQVDQLRLLIDDLALLGESEIREIALNRQWVNIEDIIQIQCHSYAYLVKQKNIQLTYHIKSDLPPVFIDANRISQIIANLLHNAYKYSPVGSCITVSTEIQQAADNVPLQLLIEVSDTGAGIDPEEQERIFDLLYRSPRQRNMHKGMGIGLALSKRLAEAHGGTLYVKSALGEGSTFTLSLPVTTSVLLDIP